MPEQEKAEPVLELSGVTGGYGKTTVLRQVNLSVPRGQVVAALGANGAGKTTMLRVASGTLRPSEGSVTLAGKDVTKLAPHKRAKGGLCHITDGRAIFPSMTVRENLEMAVPPWVKDGNLDEAIELFPRLGDRLKQKAGSMSGGEQQMLALSRAFLARPSVVLVDEVSTGLAPVIVDELFRVLKVLADRGVSLLLVEQYVHRALAMADLVYVLNRGEIVFTGEASKVSESVLAEAYLAQEA
jgi:branched-chain amino acid transport system ATP-binding protein